MRDVEDVDAAVGVVDVRRAIGPVRAAALLVVALVLLLPLPVGTAHAAADRGWGWPLPGRPEVLRGFAPGPTPYSPGHYGVDLGAAPGTPVLATGPGTVSFAGLVAGRGVVVVEHGALRTSHEPVEALVAVGDVVARGEVLGLVDPHGHACPSTCLHWGLRDGERYLDPLRLLSRPVRLLPSSGDAVALRPGPGPRALRLEPRPGALRSAPGSGAQRPLPATRAPADSARAAPPRAALLPAAVAQRRTSPVDQTVRARGTTAASTALAAVALVTAGVAAGVPAGRRAARSATGLPPV